MKIFGIPVVIDEKMDSRSIGMVTFGGWDDVQVAVVKNVGEPTSSAVCPACVHGMCDDCCGPGCYCDCQNPDEPFYDDGENDTMVDGYA